MAFLAPIAPILGAVGAGVSALGTIESGLSQSAAAHYQAQVAANNAIIASRNAAYSAAAGETQAAESSMKNAAVVGRIKAAQGANQIDVNSGSAVDVQRSQREAGELSAETVQNNALLQAYGYRTQATSFQGQSQLESAEAAQAPIGAAIGAAGTLLGNASAIGYKWNAFNNAGNLSEDSSPGYGKIY